MRIHEKCANPFDGWIYLAQPDASIRPSCQRRLRCRARLRLAPIRKILSHPARFACQKQNYYEHGRRAISNGPPWPANTLTSTRLSTLQRWQLSALRMPQHWMLLKARAQLTLSQRRHYRSLVEPDGNTEARLPSPTSDPVFHIRRWRLLRFH